MDPTSGATNSAAQDLITSSLYYQHDLLMFATVPAVLLSAALTHRPDSGRTSMRMVMSSMRSWSVWYMVIMVEVSIQQASAGASNVSARNSVGDYARMQAEVPKASQ